jgi:glycosyltransferase involved in cell wall biosynthesis
MMSGAGSEPLVSCIMPTRDRRRFVAQAIDYFLRQDYANRELVIVDDGADAVADLVPAGEPVRYLRLRQPASIGAKRNLACEHAHGEILAHWDDDDWQGPHRLRHQVDALLRDGSEVCGINRLLFLDIRDGRAWRYTYPADQPLWLSGSTLCYLRAFWADHRFVELDQGEDAAFVWSGDPERMTVLPDGAFHVGIIHGRNASPKPLDADWWQPFDAEEVWRLLGDDAGFYRPGRSDGDPASHLAHVEPGSDVTMAVPCVAVVVTCHEPYLRWLPEALASIDRQAPGPAERIVLFDRCQPPAAGHSRWRFLTGDWGHPSGARNVGLHATRAPWLVFWDTDNLMPAGYLAAVQDAIDAAPNDLAILYPDIQLHDEHLTPQGLWAMPAWDYWGLRAENCIDTSAAWRREAVEIAGGWSDRVDAFEDYALALDITALGWKAAKLAGPPVGMRSHPQGRMQRRWADGGVLTDVWRARSLAVVSLLAGRDATFGAWERFLLDAELPPRTALYVVDNSGRPEFSRLAFDACQRIASVRGLTHLDFAVCGRPYQQQPAEPYFVEGRHFHIARLYASVIPRVAEDLMLTLEDDVEPPPDAARRLGEQIGFTSWGKVGVVAAAYSIPQNTDYVCAGVGDTEWGPAIGWQQLPSQPIDVGYVGGGCTVWANWVLRGSPVNFWWNQGMGWDAALCVQMRQKGFGVRLHGGVRCEHHLHGRVGGA